MRVGVCLGDFVPEVGGGYTFVSQVFDAFLRIAHSSPHQFVVFCDRASAELHRSREDMQGLQFYPLPPRRLTETALNTLKTYSPLFALVYRRPSRFERAALERKVEFVWFVGGGVYDTPDIPYVGTVWDVQHRNHPWFPEAAAHGRWDYRELAHARFLRRAAYVITGTKTGSEQLGWFYHVPPERIRILPHPTPMMPATRPDFEPGVASSLAGRKFVFYPAQFWPHKNHVNLLHALKLLREKYVLSVDLVLTGSDKGNLAHVKSVADALGLTPAVHILGFVKADTIVWLYRHAVALVYASFSGPENLPPLEAASLGCPVVISDYPGAREQTEHSAVYFDPRDPSSIAEALKKVIESPDLRQDLINRGYTNVVRRTAEKYVKGVFSIFDEFEVVRRSWK